MVSFLFIYENVVGIVYSNYHCFVENWCNYTLHHHKHTNCSMGVETMFTRIATGSPWFCVVFSMSVFIWVQIVNRSQHTFADNRLHGQMTTFCGSCTLLDFLWYQPRSRSAMSSPIISSAPQAEWLSTEFHMELLCFSPRSDGLEKGKISSSIGVNCIREICASTLQRVKIGECVGSILA